jgi:TolB-like protein
MRFRLRRAAGKVPEPTAAERAAARWYVAVDTATETTSGLEAERDLTAWLARDAGNADALARCHAAAELTRLSRERPALRSAFDDAAQLAAAARAPALPAAARWYRRPAIAWSVALIAVLTAAGRWLAPPGTDGPGPVEISGGNPASGMPAAVQRPDASMPDLAERFGATAPAVVLPGPGDVIVDARSVAVLPFGGIAGLAPAAAVDSDTLELAGRLYEDVLRQLAALPGFYVVDRGSVAAYANEDVPLEDLAARLGVRGIVEASVASVGGEVSVTLRLTDAYHLKRTEESIDRPSEQVALLDTDIAANIALAFVDGADLTDLALPQSYGDTQ